MQPLHQPLFLFLLSACCLFSLTSPASPPSSSPPQPARCIQGKPDEPKYFYYGNRALNIRILTTSRVTHRLTSTILQIFAEEVLGYSNVTLHYLEDPTQGFDPDTQFSYISSCTDQV